MLRGRILTKRCNAEPLITGLSELALSHSFSLIIFPPSGQIYREYAGESLAQLFRALSGSSKKKSIAVSTHICAKSHIERAPSFFLAFSIRFRNAPKLPEALVLFDLYVARLSDPEHQP